MSACCGGKDADWAVLTNYDPLERPVEGAVLEVQNVRSARAYGEDLPEGRRGLPGGRWAGAAAPAGLRRHCPPGQSITRRRGARDIKVRRPRAKVRHDIAGFTAGRAEASPSPAP